MPCACEQRPRDYLAGARSGNSIRAELLCLLIGKQSQPDQYFHHDCYIGFKLPIFTKARISGKSATKTAMDHLEARSPLSLFRRMLGVTVFKTISGRWLY
jgi:hypothetical protein